MADATLEESPTPLTTRGGVFGLIALMGVIELLSGATQGYINPLLPALGPVFTITDPTISGMFVVSNLAFAVFTPVISRMGDIYGNRMLLRVTTAIVALGVLLMAVLPTMVTMFVGVALLACVVGFIPMMTGILRFYSPKHTRLGVSLMVGSLFLSLGLGALIAGIIGENNPLRGFWVAVPVAAVALAGTFLLPRGGKPTKERLRWPIVGACSLGLIGIVTATSMGPTWGWVSAPTLLVAAGGVVFLAVWIWHDARSERPFVPLKMFRVPQLRIVSIVTLLLGFTLGYLGTNNIYLSVQHSQAGYGFGFSPAALAIVFFSVTFIGFLASMAVSPLLNRLGERATLVVSSLVIASCFVLLLAGSASEPVTLVGLALFGVGLGLFESATRALCVESVPKDETSTASGINELALSIGIALGAAVVTMIARASTSGTIIPLHGFQTMWTVMLVVALISGAVALLYRRSEVDPITGLVRTAVPRSGHTVRASKRR